jgi:hypothetical protein
MTTPSALSAGSECRRDPMESLAISFRNLTKLTAEVGKEA